MRTIALAVALVLGIAACVVAQTSPTPTVLARDPGVRGGAAGAGGAIAGLTARQTTFFVEGQAEFADVDGKQVLVVRVGRGEEAPYGVSTTERRIDYYVRRSGTTSPATPADVLRFVASRIPAGHAPTSWLR